MSRKLTKDTDDDMLFGVCSGLSKFSGVDATLIRLAFVFGAVFSGTVLLWVYIVLAIILPKEEKEND